jgi:hypothetical protein
MDPSAGTQGPIPTHHSPEQRLGRLVDLLTVALGDASVARRLAEAGIVVRIDLVDAPGAALTFLFDRTPPSAVGGTAPDWPAVRLWMTLDDLESICNEGSYLPMKILSGEVRFEGMVRKFLRVMPILRRALDDALHDGS